MSTVQLHTFTGSGVKPYLPALARLRIEIFRDYPYLYEGSLDYEEEYLERLIKYPDSILILALDGDRVVGACTGNPLQYAEEFQTPFIKAGLDVSQYFYCGEAILQKNYRSRGIGKKFFQMLEEHAKNQFKYICLSEVERPPDHPMLSKDYHSLDPFWEKIGYIKHPELVVHYPWPEIGQSQETDHPMVFWIKELY